MTASSEPPKSIGVFLRAEPERFREWMLRRQGNLVGFCVAAIVIGAGSYGAAMGSWRDPLQALYTGIKLPLVILLTTLGNGLLNGMLAPLLGLNVTFRQSLAMVLMSFAVTAMVLGALSPVALFIVWNTPPLAAGTTTSSPEYALLQLTLAVFVALAGVMGNLRLVPLLREWSGSPAVARNVLLAWLAGNLFSWQPDLLGAAAVHLGGEPPGGIHRAKLLSRQFFRDNLQGSGQTDILMKARMKRILAGLVALAVAALIWLPCLHFVFAKPVSNFRRERGLSPEARQLAARHLQLWTDPALRQTELNKMRVSNAEWDFMGRSYLVWSLANMALRDPASKPLYLRTMDQIIDETLRLEKQEGMYFFLMPYAKDGAYFMQPPHSLFLDGEIALMLASRRVVEEKPEYKALLTERVNAIVTRFQKSPQMMLESYPNECWMFDHCVALDAIKISDYLDGTDHSELIRNWIAMAKQKLVDPKSGLLVSSFTTQGEPLAGPEGSSIWMVAHSLQLLDEDFARDQYQRARKNLGAVTLGFGYAHEWPKSWMGEANIDSGPIIPVFDVSAGSSGMAFIGASSFGDDKYLASLAATLDFAGFPSRTGGRLKYCASNQVGDAALLYAATLGPLWEKVKTGTKL